MRVALRKRRICGSSSTRTTTGSGIERNRRRWRPAQWQREEEGHAAFGQVLGPDAPAVRLDHAATDGEAEAGAAATRGVSLVELLEHLFFFAGRQARAAVGGRGGGGACGGRGGRGRGGGGGGGGERSGGGGGGAGWGRRAAAGVWSAIAARWGRGGVCCAKVSGWWR